MANRIVTVAAGASESDIQAALISAKDGDTVRLAPNQIVDVSRGLILDVSQRAITLDLNGATLRQAANVVVVSIKGDNAAPTSASLGRLEGAVTVSYAGADPVRPGDWVKIFSDDILPNDQGAATRLGQAMKVSAVHGSTLTLEGPLLYENAYATNVRAALFESKTGSVANGTITGDRSHPSWTADLLQVRSAVNARIDHILVRDGNSTGINVIDGVNTQVTQSAAFNLSDNVAQGERGYGVHSASSVGTVVDGFYAQSVRHGVDNNAVGLSATNSNPSKYGADIGLEVRNAIVNGASATAFSWHSEGRQSTIHDSIAINSWGVLGARGVGNSMYDVAAANTERGIQFYEYGDGDGSHITISQVRMTDLSVYAFTNVRAVHDNVIQDSVFEVSSVDRFSFEGITASNSIVRGGSGVQQMAIGGAGTDRLLGTGANDMLLAGAGNDYIWGGPGADRLTGGPGIDRFAYYGLDEAGDVIFDFSTGNGGDVLDLSVIALRLGWGADPVAKGQLSVEQMGADAVVHVLSGGERATLATVLNVDAAALEAHVSTQIVVTDPDGTKSFGPEANPWASSQALALGGSGNDQIFGDASGRRLIGAEGDDSLYDLGSSPAFLGGSGLDLVSYRYAQDAVVADLLTPSNNRGWAEGDKYSQIESLEGSDHADVLGGNVGVNRLFGRAGDDRLHGLGGTDYLDGGEGNDFLYGGDRNDELRGRQGEDHLDGGDGNDFLDGGAGNDIVLGGTGNDRFQDYGGSDIFTGGAGKDMFVFTDPSSGTDRITDFEHGLDHIQIYTEFLGLEAETELPLFFSQQDARDDGAFLLYDTMSGDLDFYAAPGAQAANVMHLYGAPSLALGDIYFS